MAASALRIIRPLVRVSSFIAPKTAGHLAFKAFCTPPRRRQGTAGRSGVVKTVSERLAAAERQSIPYACGTVTAYVLSPTGRISRPRRRA